MWKKKGDKDIFPIHRIQRISNLVFQCHFWHCFVTDLSVLADCFFAFHPLCCFPVCSWLFLSALFPALPLILLIITTIVSVSSSTSADCCFWSSTNFSALLLVIAIDLVPHPPAPIFTTVTIVLSTSFFGPSPLMQPHLLMNVDCNCSQACCFWFFQCSSVMFAAVTILVNDVSVADCCCCLVSSHCNWCNYHYCLK